MHMLTLSPEHLQIIRSALGQAPYDISAPIIAEISRQIAEQKKPQDTDTVGD